MSLKTSYFNKTIFKANIKRFWWIAAIYFIAFITFGILPMIDSASNSTEGFMVMNVISCGIAALMPTILFSYLDSAGSVTCMHAFPIKRKAHYITHLATIYAIILIPAAVCYIFGAIYQAAAANNAIYTLGSRLNTNFGEMFIVLIMLVTIFASGGVLGSMVTGNPIAAVAFSGLFIGLPYYTELLFATFLQENIYGIWEYDYITLTGFSLYEITPYMITAFIVWTLMLVASWFLYKNRKLETNGDIISFNFLKPVFMACVSGFLGLLGYFYLYSLFGRHSIFYMLPFGLLGIIISNMLAKKAFTFKGLIKPGVIYIAWVILLYATVTFDLTGYEKRIPDIDDIASVTLSREESGRYYDEDVNLAYWINDEKYYYTDPKDPGELAFTDTADIENVRKLHADMISDKNKDKLKDNLNVLPIVYTLKNGSTLKRKYYASFTEDSDVLRPVYETKQMRLAKYDILRDYDKTITGISITDRRIAGESTSFDIYAGDDEKAKALMQAFEADALEADYKTITNYNSQAVTRLEINYTRPAKTKDGKEYNYRDDGHSDTIVIGVTPAFKRTNALLTEYGLENVIVKPEKIKSVKVEFINRNDTLHEITYTGRDEVEQLYNSFFGLSTVDGFSINEKLEYAQIELCDESGKPIFTTSISYRNTGWPAFIALESEKAAKNLPDNAEDDAFIPRAESVAVIRD